MKKFNSWAVSALLGMCWIQPGLAEREVSVVRLGDIAFAKTLQFPASVINLQLADIAAETSGRILSFSALAGDDVKKGQVIIKLDCQSARINQTRIEAGLKQLTARRQLTEQQLKRAKRLNKTNSISREELDQRETQLVADNASIEELQASLEAARQSVDHCEIKAPFSGLILEKKSSVGSYATPGTPQFTLIQPDALEVRLEIPLDQVKPLRQADSIQFSSAGVDYELKIRKVLPVVDSGSHQQVVFLDITSTSLPPGGSFGLVNFKTKAHYIPARYIQKRKGQFGVFTVMNNLAQFTPLPHVQEGQSVASDLPADSIIISNPLQLISDNEKIKLKP